MTTRANFTFDAVSNTAYGPLVAHAEYPAQPLAAASTASRSVGSDGGLNRAYVTWAGLTAGKIDSFFSFTGGGLGWANFFSPDRKGYAQPDVLAYTANFGGGFAATISLENPYQPTVARRRGRSRHVFGATWGRRPGRLPRRVGGMRVPDIVGALSVHQAWGAAQISGVAHNIRAASMQGDGVDASTSGASPSTRACRSTSPTCRAA